MALLATTGQNYFASPAGQGLSAVAAPSTDYWGMETVVDAANQTCSSHLARVHSFLLGLMECRKVALAGADDHGSYPEEAWALVY